MIDGQRVEVDCKACEDMKTCSARERKVVQDRREERVRVLAKNELEGVVLNRVHFHNRTTECPTKAVREIPELPPTPYHGFMPGDIAANISLEDGGKVVILNWSDVLTNTSDCAKEVMGGYPKDWRNKAYKNSIPFRHLDGGETGKASWTTPEYLRKVRGVGTKAKKYGDYTVGDEVIVTLPINLRAPCKAVVCNLSEVEKEWGKDNVSGTGNIPVHLTGAPIDGMYYWTPPPKNVKPSKSAMGMPPRITKEDILAGPKMASSREREIVKRYSLKEYTDLQEEYLTPEVLECDHHGIGHCIYCGATVHEEHKNGAPCDRQRLRTHEDHRRVHRQEVLDSLTPYEDPILVAHVKRIHAVNLKKDKEAYEHLKGRLEE